MFVYAFIIILSIAESESSIYHSSLTDRYCAIPCVLLLFYNPKCSSCIILFNFYQSRISVCITYNNKSFIFCFYCKYTVFHSKFNIECLLYFA